MITSSRLIQQADTDGVPTPTVERDYVLTHVLAAIASTPDAHRMIFKGGTALRRRPRLESRRLRCPQPVLRAWCGYGVRSHPPVSRAATCRLVAVRT